MTETLPDEPSGTIDLQGELHTNPQESLTQPWADDGLTDAPPRESLDAVLARRRARATASWCDQEREWNAIDTMRVVDERRLMFLRDSQRKRREVVFRWWLRIILALVCIAVVLAVFQLTGAQPLLTEGAGVVLCGGMFLLLVGRRVYFAWSSVRSGPKAARAEIQSEVTVASETT